MKIRNYEDDEDLDVGTGLFADIGPYDHVSVLLPSGHVITVFADKIYAREPMQDRHADGQQIWTVHDGTRPAEPCPECGHPAGRTSHGKVRRHGTVVALVPGMKSYPICPGSGTMLEARP